MMLAKSHIEVEYQAELTLTRLDHADAALLRRHEAARIADWYCLSYDADDDEIDIYRAARLFDGLLTHDMYDIYFDGLQKGPKTLPREVTHVICLLFDADYSA